MKKLVLLILVSFLSCGKTIGPGVNMDVFLRILFEDIEGKSILLSPNPEFTLDDLKLFYYNNQMQYVVQYDSRLDYPYFIQSFDSSTVSLIPVFGVDDGTYVEGGISTSYLDFGNGDIDTIQVSGLISNSATRIYNVWYNGTQVQWKNNCGELDPCGFRVVK